MDLAHFAADYAYKLYAVHVKHEYEEQIDVTWKQHVNSLLAAAKTGYKNHEEFLKQIKAQQLADEQARAQMMMMVFSFLAGPAISWVSGAIQYTLVPKLLGKPGATWSTVAKINRTPGDVHYELDRNLRVVDMRSHNRVLAKVLGDFGGNLVPSMLTVAKASAPDRNPLEKELAKVGNSVSTELFERNINNALLAAKSECGTAILNYAKAILDDSEFGRKWVKKLDEKQPGLKGEKERETAIRRLIGQSVDEQRRQWAKDWIYFGNNPTPISDNFAAIAFEAELWALWFLQEEYSLSRTPNPDPLIVQTYSTRIRSKSNIDIDRVLARLVDLGVVGARNDAEHDKIFKRKVDGIKNQKPEPTCGPPGSVANWPTKVGPHVKLRDPNIDREAAGLLPIQVAEIEDDVDTKDEMDALHAWAEDSSKPHLRWWKLPMIPRAITPINP